MGFSIFNKEEAKEDPTLECPMNKETLGSATWSLLHTMGLAYPENPSKEYQAKTRAFIETFALLYPCPPCAEDFQKEIARSPPQVASKKTLSLWLCEQHNLVSKKLNKPTFECTMENLEERWWTGSPGCNE